MRRIAVIGNGGGGKSTLARALGKHLGIPVHEVDQVQWLPGWRRAPLDEVAPILEGWAAQDAWIIDGFGPWPVIDRRMGRADTIVYVDLPFRTHLWWAAKRQIVSLVQRRAWAGQGAPPPSLLMFRTLRRVHSMRPDLLELVTKGDRVAKLVHFRSTREMTAWLDEVTRTTARVAD
ncbi:MAG TPA: flagellar protein FlaR [Candidatus Limnocylindria bacterium]